MPKLSVCTAITARQIALSGALIVLSADGWTETTTDCEATPKVSAHTTLGGLANYWFGSPDYRFAILTATNARSSEARFAYIANPNQLPTGSAEVPNQVCIPQIAEAERLKLRFDAYLLAVHDMALAEPGEIVNTLDPVPASDPVTVVSWVRAAQVKSFPDKPGSTYTTSDNLWVTLAPKIREFCRQFADERSDDPERVALRLEQRLGLAPASNKTHFVELAIAAPADGKSLFRPCAETVVTTTRCDLGPPTTCQNSGDKICHQRSDFFYQQYYSSYGSARPVEYPWTSLGYTFDWDYKDAGLIGKFSFVEVGESEYVVPPKTALTFLGKYTTADYCGLK